MKMLPSPKAASAYGPHETTREIKNEKKTHNFILDHKKHVAPATFLDAAGVMSRNERTKQARVVSITFWGFHIGRGVFDLQDR